MRSVAGPGYSGAQVQGFRTGGGVEKPYVFLMVSDGDGPVGLSLTIEQANELGEYLRQEAEFAGSPREEGK